MTVRKNIYVNSIYKKKLDNNSMCAVQTICFGVSVGSTIEKNVLMDFFLPILNLIICNLQLSSSYFFFFLVKISILYIIWLDLCTIWPRNPTTTHIIGKHNVCRYLSIYIFIKLFRLHGLVVMVTLWFLRVHDIMCTMCTYTNEQITDWPRTI